MLGHGRSKARVSEAVAATVVSCVLARVSRPAAVAAAVQVQRSGGYPAPARWGDRPID